MTEVHCTYDPDTRSGTPGADARKVKGNIHWLSAAHAVPAEVRIYDRLFKVPFPGARNPWGNRAARCRRAAPAHHAVVAGDEDARRRRGRAQLSRRPQPRFEARHPRVRRAGARSRAARRARSSSSGTATSWPTSPTTRPPCPVFNRSVTLKDSWAKSGERRVASRRARCRCAGFVRPAVPHLALVRTRPAPRC